MAGDGAELVLKVRTRITKFAEGADPEKDKPYAIEERETIFVGSEAISVLTTMGGKLNGPNPGGT